MSTLTVLPDPNSQSVGAAMLGVPTGSRAESNHHYVVTERKNGGHYWRFVARGDVVSAPVVSAPAAPVSDDKAAVAAAVLSLDIPDSQKVALLAGLLAAPAVSAPAVSAPVPTPTVSSGPDILPAADSVPLGTVMDGIPAHSNAKAAHRYVAAERKVGGQYWRFVA